MALREDLFFLYTLLVRRKLLVACRPPPAPHLSESSRNEASFRAIYENAPFMINSFGADRKMLLWNRACEQLLGYSMQEVNDAPDPFELFYPDLELRAQVMAAVNTRDGKFREFKVRRRDGQYIYQMWANFALADGSAISVGYDVTEMREVREQLREMNMNLEKKVAERTRELDEQRAKLFFASKFVALGEMAGGVAHEINNPLAVISGYTTQLTEMIQKENPNLRAVGEMLGSMRAAVDRITRIIAGLRSIARDGRRAPFVDCRLAEVINATLDLCRERFTSSGVALTLALELPEATVKGRCVELEQVVLNLLNNAFDAVEGQQEPWVKLRVFGDDRLVYLSVTDSGSGISEEVKHRLFEPFFTTKPVGRGMGLGLSISRSILSAHGGTLHVETENGHTCFLAKLPRTG